MIFTKHNVCVRNNRGSIRRSITILEVSFNAIENDPASEINAMINAGNNSLPNT